MSDRWTSPGRAAREAYVIGVKAAIIIAVCGIGALYWSGFIAPFSVLLALILWLPVYYVLVAVFLSKWLGLDPGITDLEAVNPEE